MKRKICTYSAALLIAFFTPFGSVSGEDSKKDPGEVDGLLRLDQEFDQATAERGVEAWVSYFAENGSMLSPFAENGSMLSPSGPPVTGREAIRQVMSSVFSQPGFSLRWRPQRVESLIPGDLGYTLGRYERRLKNPDGKRTVERGTYFTLWRKQSDGAWKVVVDTGTPDGPTQVED